HTQNKSLASNRPRHPDTRPGTWALPPGIKVFTECALSQTFRERCGRSSTPSSGTGNFIFSFFSSRRRHTRLVSDWSSDVCSSDLTVVVPFIAFAIVLLANWLKGSD